MSRVLVSMLNASVISSSSGYSLLLCQLSFHICTFCIFSLSHCLHCFCLYLWILPYFKKKKCTEMGEILRSACVPPKWIHLPSQRHNQPKSAFFLFTFMYYCQNTNWQMAFHYCALILKLTSHFIVEATIR